MKFNRILSPNFTKKPRKLSNIRHIILHYTGMQSKGASIKKLISLNHEVSCHYLIDRLGNITNMVEDQNIAWHAGKSKWKNFENLNHSSVGIELVNKGHSFGYENFSNKQINSLIKLCLYLKKKYKIKNSNILGHSDIAPLRKKDPGEKFPWIKLSKNKIGTWYLEKKSKIKNVSKNKRRKLFFKNLSKIGYKYFNKDKKKYTDKLIVLAFQSRYCQNEVSGKIDQKTFEISQLLVNNLKN